MAPELMHYFYLLALRWLAAPAAGQAQVPTQHQARHRYYENNSDARRPVLVEQRAEMARLPTFRYLLAVPAAAPGATTRSARLRHPEARAYQQRACLVAFTIAG